MQPKSLSSWLRAFAVSFAIVLFLTSAWAADHETVLHNFGDGLDDGIEPTNLIMDAAGNLYGTTRVGGGCNCGTVFELSPVPGGGWTESVLHNFVYDGIDGYEPLSITMDAAGNLYGTTQLGGVHNAGTVFELSPMPGGRWAETVLYSFAGGNDGSQAFGTLVMDNAGNLYGTTFDGGSLGEGTVFELSPGEGGDWTKTVLHSFGEGYDGSFPYAGVILDSAGNLYGTTEEGGHPDGGYCQIFGCGTVFELSPSADGWTESVLYSFYSDSNDSDGWQPWGSLIMDSAGHLYGTTVFGGPYCLPAGSFGCGTVFELSPNAGGGWTEAVLYSFSGPPDDGGLPEGSLILDAVGNLYGTTVYGASGGTVFELSPMVGGGWRESLLYGFGDGNDGGDPSANVVMDRAGDLYGTTGYGGIYYAGIAFELTPPYVRPAASAAR